jgi:hypothetical protein
MRNRVEAGAGRWNDRWSGLASVLGAVPYAPGRSRRAVLANSRSRACPPVRLPVPVVSAIGADFHRGLNRRRSGGRPKRHETLREPMERRQGRRNDRRSKLAAVFIAVPIAPRLRRFVFGRFRSRLCPSARSCFYLPVRLPVSLVATVGALYRTRTECRRARRPAGGPIHNGARGARPLPVGHRRVGQHADAHLPLLGNPVLRAHPQGRIYVRG